MFIYTKLLLNLLYVRQLMEFGLSYFIIIIILFYFEKQKNPELSSI